VVDHRFGWKSSMRCSGAGKPTAVIYQVPSVFTRALFSFHCGAFHPRLGYLLWRNIYQPDWALLVHFLRTFATTEGNVRVIDKERSPSTSASSRTRSRSSPYSGSRPSWASFVSHSSTRSKRRSDFNYAPSWWVPSFPSPSAPVPRAAGFTGARTVTVAGQTTAHRTRRFILVACQCVCVCPCCIVTR